MSEPTAQLLGDGHPLSHLSQVECELFCTHWFSAKSSLSQTIRFPSLGGPFQNATAGPQGQCLNGSISMALVYPVLSEDPQDDRGSEDTETQAD